MKHKLEVCLATVILTSGLVLAARQPRAATPAGSSSGGAAQALQKGISVKLPVTKNAAPVPEADQPDATIVSITRDGGVFLGIRPVAPDALTKSVRAGLANHAGKQLYIKADALAPYADVIKVLDTLSAANVKSAVLLTDQKGTPEPGRPLPSNGLEVLVGPRHAGPEVVTLQLAGAGGRIALKLNNRRISWESLPDTLKRLFQGRSEKAVLVRADGAVAYGYVVRAADICRSSGAAVALNTRASNETQ